MPVSAMMFGLPFDVFETVKRALAEDVGSGDVTSQYTVPEDTEAHAVMTANASGVVAGLPVAALVFSQVDASLDVQITAVDGQTVEAGDSLMTVSGSARSILTAERTALNFVQRLSGIATKTASFVRLVEGTKARIADTRKTTPGLRNLEKYAVRKGGGYNHRSGLFDAVLIKDNHIAAAGGITLAVQAAYAQAPHTMTVTVECDTIVQVEEAVAAGADIILLDNMSITEIEAAVDTVDGHAAIEASGGITEANIGEVAGSGVDIISVGALTHSAVALDVGLDLTRR
jgi:nicotinate-nucleotide pyrophosphorylase (carboxylating)